MRRLAALVASIAALLLPVPARGAPVVDLFLTQVASTNDWNLTLSTASPVIVTAVAVEIRSAGLGSFVIGQPDSIIDPFISDGGFSFSLNSVGLLRISLGGNAYSDGTSGSPAYFSMVIGPTSSFLIGTFTGMGDACASALDSGCIFLLPANPLDGYTVWDEYYEPLAFSLTTASNPIPEPSSVLLMLVGGAIVASQVRRRF